VLRESVHIEPIGIVGIARHYIRDLVYGANDGIITTFAVVAGVAGGSLSTLDRWWKAGFEMLALGGLIAVAAYGAAALVVRVAD
jgi:hypothetical protein